MDRPPPLTPLREDWQRALVVVAHPDDMEFGAAAAVARWTTQGKQVIYSLVTSGEAGIDGMDPERSRTVREAEQRESCRIVGVDEVEFLGMPDGVLEYGVPLRREIAAAIRRHQPEIVITNNFRESWDGRMINQSDHIATGRATVDAARDAANRWVFADQVVAGLEPWGGVKQVWAAGSPSGKHAVDITDTFETGIESLRAHKEYLDGLGWGDQFDPAEFLEGMARQVGQGLSVGMAVGFEVFALSWNPDD